MPISGFYLITFYRFYCINTLLFFLSSSVGNIRTFWLNSELCLKTKTKTYPIDALHHGEIYLINTLYHGIQTWILHIIICSTRKKILTLFTKTIYFIKKPCLIKKQSHTEKQVWQKISISPIYASLLLNVNWTYMEKILYLYLISLLITLCSSKA